MRIFSGRILNIPTNIETPFTIFLRIIGSLIYANFITYIYSKEAIGYIRI